MAGTFVEHVNQLAADLTVPLIADITAVAADQANIDIVAANIANVNTVAGDAADINSIVATVIPNMAEILLADNNAVTATTGATNAQLRVWEAQAERMTADSYATEPEDVFVKVYTSAGNGTFTSVNTAEYSALHWRNKTAGLILSVPLIDDNTPSLTTAYSGTKTQIMHDAQAVAISNLSGASATIHNHVSQPIPESPAAFVDLTWTNDQASTNTNILDLGTNAFILKQNGSYNFYSTLTYYRLSDGSPLTVTYELYDSVSMAVLGTFTQALDMTAGTKITVPMNALLVIAGMTTGQTKSVKVRMQSTAVNGTVELFDFHSILALSSVSIVPTIDAVPTDGSANLVASNGVFDALALKADIALEELGATADLNTLTTTGRYSQSTTAEAGTGSNYPVAQAGFLEVIAYSNQVMQVYWEFNSSNIYTRAKYSTAPWSSWIKLAREDQTLQLSGGTMTGAITALRETKVAMGANNIDLSAGNLFTKTISGATTLTVSNWLATGNANSFILELTNGGSAVITWFSGVKWAGGSAPTLTAAGVDILGFYSHDGGTTVRGIVLAKDSK